MSRHLKFEVTVVFSDAITSDEDIMTIAENIAKGIRHRANEEGISPDESDFYAQMVHIKPQFVDDTVSLKSNIMTRDEAETLPLIELAEMLIENSDDYEGLEATEIVDGLDRYDTIEELDDLGIFDND